MEDAPARPDTGFRGIPCLPLWGETGGQIAQLTRIEVFKPVYRIVSLNVAAIFL